MAPNYLLGAMNLKWVHTSPLSPYLFESHHSNFWEAAPAAAVSHFHWSCDLSIQAAPGNPATTADIWATSVVVTSLSLRQLPFPGTSVTPCFSQLPLTPIGWSSFPAWISTIAWWILKYIYIYIKIKTNFLTCSTTHRASGWMDLQFCLNCSF